MSEGNSEVSSCVAEKESLSKDICVPSNSWCDDLSMDDFVQVKAEKDDPTLVLIDAWTTELDARHSGILLALLKKHIPQDCHEVPHVRRFVKKPLEEGKDLKLLMFVCTKDTANEDEMKKVLKSIGEEDERLAGLPLFQSKISKYAAKTQEDMKVWASQSWPMIWRRNPNIMDTKFDSIELAQIRKYLELLVEKVPEGGLPIRAIVVDPVKDVVRCSQVDCRHKSVNPLDHGIMQILARIAREEVDKRKSGATTDLERDYLCLNQHVYITHEPCVMCAMALVHSRIARLFYVRQSPESGAIEPTSGGGFGVHWKKQLNHRYEAFRVVKKDVVDRVAKIDTHISV